MSEIFSVDVEGGDQVGKGDAVKNIAAELAGEGFDVSVVSFPCYATPIGFSIREILRRDMFADFGMSERESVYSRLSLFALNRLEVLNSIMQSKDSSLYVFDRGPFSHALTIAYALAKGYPRSMTEELAKNSLAMDSFFRKQMNIDGCVIRLFDEGKVWVKSRLEADDMYESDDVQEIGNEVYEIFSKEIGMDWIDIASRNRDGWRSREDILHDCLSFIKPRVKLSPEKVYKVLKYLSIDNVCAGLYQGSKIDERALNLFSESLSGNDKKRMYEASERIAYDTALTVRRIKWYNDEIKEVVRDILNSNWGVSCLMERLYGEGFVVKLLKSVQNG